MAMWLLAALIVVASATAVYVWGELYGTFLKKQEPEELAATLRPHMQFVRPDAADDGPVPTVVLFHGCGGLVGREGPKEIMDRYAEAAREVGVAAVIVDSLRPRGIDFEAALDTVCSGGRLRGGERAGDVLATLLYVRELDFVDRDRIALAGWSHGGWAVMDLMTFDLSRERPYNLASAPADALDSIAAIHLTYPFCGFPARSLSREWRATPPTRWVKAENDTVAEAEPCRKAMARVRAAGVTIDERLFQGQTHGFDERDQIEGSASIYSADAASTALGEFQAWLLRTLVSPPSPAPAVNAASGDVDGE